MPARCGVFSQRMRLREKVFWSIVLTLFALIVLLSSTASILILSNARELEERRISDNHLRVQGYIEGERSRLAFLSQDWGFWTETYNLVSGIDTNYFDRNINKESLVNFAVNTVMFTHMSNGIVWTTDFDIERKEQVPTPDERARAITGNPLLMHTPDARKPVAGFMMIGKQPTLLASAPILTSNYEGPAAGSLVFVRNLDEGFLKLMAERIRLPVRIWTIDEFREDPAHGDLIDSLMRPGAGKATRHDDEKKYVYIGERDMSGQLAAIVEFSFTRDIYYQALRQMGILILSIFLSAHAFGAVIWRILKKHVLNRLGVMNEEVAAIKETRDMSRRIGISGSDEISELGHEVNRMLLNLQEQRNLSELYLNIAAIMIGTLDREGRISMINPRGCELLGFRREEIIGMDWFSNFVPERIRNELIPLYQKIMAGEMEIIRFYENAVVTSSGEEKMISFHNELIRDEQGGITGLIFSGEDITDRQRRDAERTRIEKLESLGIMAGGIAHDFNNTLTAILANIDLLQPAANLPAAEREEIIHDATEATLRARDLATQLLTFAKGGEPVRETIHLPDLVKNSVRFALRGLNTKYDIDIHAGTWPAPVDITQISQVLHNIVINGAHAMSSGGKIDVAVTNIDITTESDVPVKAGPYVMIELRDHGHGIPTEDIGRIFDPYYTTKKGGSGLGLSTAYSIVRRHGGHIGVESKINMGSTFRIYLPAQPEARVTTTAGATFGTASLGRILVVDDDDVVSRVIQRILGAANYEVSLAANSTAALKLQKDALTRQAPFHLVMTDLTMPGDIGGLSILAALRRAQPDIKAIVISGYSNEPVLAEPAKYGLVCSIAKPFHSGELVRAVKLAFGQD